MRLKYSEFVNCTTLLGPGKRFVIWVDGCCFHCDGCIAEYHRANNGVWENSSYFVNRILETGDIEGLTISGGEPFLQSAALLEIVKEVKKCRKISVIVYTGFYLKELIEQSDVAKQYIPASEYLYVPEFLSEIDVLIDGRYLEEFDNGCSLVGSSNQTVYRLTDYYDDKLMEQYYTGYHRKSEIIVKKDKILLVGVPDGEQLALWKQLKDKVGNGTM